LPALQSKAYFSHTWPQCCCTLIIWCHKMPTVLRATGR
jgi:hypothetical protein